MMCKKWILIRRDSDGWSGHLHKTCLAFESEEEAKIKAMELEKAFDESVAALDEKDRENCDWAPSFSVVKIVEDMEIWVSF